LRQELVKISSLRGAGRKGLAEAIKKPFAKLEKIRTQDLGSTLHSKSGYEWQWTETGFRLFEKREKRKSALSSSAENLLSILGKLGIKEIYAPINGKPLPVLISAMTPITCYDNGLRSSGLP